MCTPRTAPAHTILSHQEASILVHENDEVGVHVRESNEQLLQELVAASVDGAVGEKHTR